MADDSEQKVRFRLCGTYLDFGISLDVFKHLSEEGLHESLLQGFGIELDAKKFHFHYDHEKCKTNRPFGDLLAEAGEYSKTDLFETIMIHTERRATDPLGIAQDSCTLSYRFRAAADVENKVKPHASGHFWPEKEQVEGAPLKYPIEALDEDIHNVLVHKIQEHRTLKHLSDLESLDTFADEPGKFEGRASRMAVQFKKAIVLSNQPGGRRIDLGSDHPYIRRLHTLQDVFVNPHRIAGRTVNLEVEVSIKHIEAEPVKTPGDLVSPHTEPSRPPTYVRLGDVRPPESRNSKDIPEIHALVGQTIGENLTLLDVKSWGVGSDVIGDPSWGEKLAFSGKDYLWDEDLQRLQNTKNLKKKLRDGARTSDKVPFLPSMSLSRFNAVKDPAWGATFHDLHLQVKIVSHVHGMAIPPDSECQITGWAPDDADEVERELRRGLSDRQQYCNERRELREILFSDYHKDLWEGELWIRPERTVALHRFKGKITDYLCQSTPDANGEINKQLYLEYHLWPKGEEILQGL